MSVYLMLGVWEVAFSITGFQISPRSPILIYNPAKATRNLKIKVTGCRSKSLGFRASGLRFRVRQFPGQLAANNLQNLPI